MAKCLHFESSAAAMILTLSVAGFAQEWSDPAHRVATNVGYVRFNTKVQDNALVSVVENADGRMQVFYRSNGDGHLYTQWQPSPNKFDEWSQPLRISDDVSQIAVARNA